MADVFRQQVESEREQIRRLGFIVDRAVLVDEFFDERFFHLVREPRVLFGVIVFAERFGDFGEQLSAARKIGGRDEILSCVPAERMFRFALGGFSGRPEDFGGLRVGRLFYFARLPVGIELVLRQPVPESPRPANAVFRAVFEIFHELLHRRIIFFENVFVAVLQVDFPRADDCRRPPRGAAGSVFAENVRRHVRNGALFGACRDLRVAQVARPLREEGTHAHVERRGRDEYLRVARPTEALVALRAVGGRGKEVAALPPLYAALQGVHLRGRTHESPDLRHGVMEDYPLHPVGRRLGVLRKPRELHISETVVGEKRRPLLNPVSLAYIRVGGTRRAVIFRIERTVLFEHLGEPHGYFSAGVGGDFYLRPADYILAEVKDESPGFESPHRHGGKFLRGGNHGAAARFEHGGLADFPNGYRLEGGIVEAGFRPIAEPAARVVVFAVVDVRIRYGAERPFPRTVSRESRAPPVLVYYFELRRKLRLFAVHRAVAAPCESSGIPAVGDYRRERVAALVEHFRDIVGGRLDPLVVVGPAGAPKVAADLSSVYVKLVYAARRDVKARAFHVVVERYLFAQVCGRKRLGYRLLLAVLQFYGIVLLRGSV